MEIGTLADDHLNSLSKRLILVLLSVYMFGAMILKAVAGSESLIESVSFNIYGDRYQLEEETRANPYYVGLVIYCVFTLAFTFGNIESSKWL